jgi:hypothetical protein
VPNFVPCDGNKNLSSDLCRILYRAMEKKILVLICAAFCTVRWKNKLNYDLYSILYRAMKKKINSDLCRILYRAMETKRAYFQCLFLFTLFCYDVEIELICI